MTTGTLTCYEHARPVVVLATWAATLFAGMLVASHRRRTSPGEPAS